METFWKALSDLPQGSEERLAFIRNQLIETPGAMQVQLQYAQDVYNAGRFSEALFLLTRLIPKESHLKEWKHSLRSDIVSKFAVARPQSGLPQFLCIGVQKAGTSWLYQNLREHTQIWLPPIKELHYFDYIFTETTRKWAHWHIKKGVTRELKALCRQESPNIDYIHYVSSLGYDNDFTFTLEWYRMAFSYQDARKKVTGDITPEYCTIPECGIQYLKHLIPEVKIIFVIRDPYERMISQVSMMASTRGFTDQTPVADWNKLVAEEIVAINGDYERQIPLWDKHFSPNRLLYLPFGMIKGAPVAYLSIVTDFLNLPQLGPEKVHKGKVWQSQKYTIPQSSLEYIKKIAEPQNEFLQQRFDKSFLQLIK